MVFVYLYETYSKFSHAWLILIQQIHFAQWNNVDETIIFSKIAHIKNVALWKDLIIMLANIQMVTTNFVSFIIEYITSDIYLLILKILFTCVFRSHYPCDIEIVVIIVRIVGGLNKICGISMHCLMDDDSFIRNNNMYHWFNKIMYPV